MKLLNQNFFTKATVYSKDKFASYDNPLKLVNGEKINNKDLLNVMLVGSVNNVARMVAQNTGLTEETFVKDVNRRLGTGARITPTYTDVTGLDAGNKSTPRDLLKIFTKVLSDEQSQKLSPRPLIILKKWWIKTASVRTRLKILTNFSRGRTRL